MSAVLSALFRRDGVCRFRFGVMFFGPQWRRVAAIQQGLLAYTLAPRGWGWCVVNLEAAFETGSQVLEVHPPSLTVRERVYGKNRAYSCVVFPIQCRMNTLQPRLLGKFREGGGK